MANIKSAMKRVKITEKQTMNNRAAKSEMKTTIRRFDEALQAGDAAAPQEILHPFCREISGFYRDFPVFCCLPSCKKYGFLVKF